MSDLKADLVRDHAGLSDNRAARRYFAKFDAILAHLPKVAAEMEIDGRLSRAEVRAIGLYLGALANTFHALSLKYLMTGRDTGVFFGSLTVDRSASGFPVYAELLTMANDALQIDRHLSTLPGPEDLREQMVDQILGARTIPTRLQYAMSQRLYFETLAKDGVFAARMDPVAVRLGGVATARRRYQLHWAVYDSQRNVPVIYVMEVEDSGKRALDQDDARWPSVQAHLMAQSVSDLKLLTIAKGFDTDFDDLHPKRLRRVHVGPMYSSTFTHQTGALADVLDAAHAPAGEDWALAWAIETLDSERVIEERAGWFGKVEREVFRLDPFGGRGAQTGATSVERAVILPQRIYQTLAEKMPPGFANVRKYVVGPRGRVLTF